MYAERLKESVWTGVCKDCMQDCLRSQYGVCKDCMQDCLRSQYEVCKDYMEERFGVSNEYEKIAYVSSMQFYCTCESVKIMSVDC